MLACIKIQCGNAPNKCRLWSCQIECMVWFHGKYLTVCSQCSRSSNSFGEQGFHLCQGEGGEVKRKVSVWWVTRLSQAYNLNNMDNNIYLLSVKPPIIDHLKCQASGRLQEVLTYESLDFVLSKFSLISIWSLQRFTPCTSAHVT